LISIVLHVKTLSPQQKIPLRLLAKPSSEPDLDLLSFTRMGAFIGSIRQRTNQGKKPDGMSYIVTAPHPVRLEIGGMALK
jgi:hypothetical protein